MGVDAAGSHESARCIDFALRAAEAIGERHDAPAAHADVAAAAVGGCGEVGVADHEVEVGHAGVTKRGKIGAKTKPIVTMSAAQCQPLS